MGAPRDEPQLLFWRHAQKTDNQHTLILWALKCSVTHLCTLTKLGCEKYFFGRVTQTDHCQGCNQHRKWPNHMYSFWNEKNLSTYTAQEDRHLTCKGIQRSHRSLAQPGFCKSFPCLVYWQEIGLKQQPWLLQEQGECWGSRVDNWGAYYQWALFSLEHKDVPPGRWLFSSALLL